MSGRFLISSTSSGRATAYIESPKIITLAGRTHVTWLDSPPEGFRIKTRTLDRSSGRWSETWTVGEAVDNHGGPAMTVDAEGYLHIVYYSHHHPFRYHRSVRPNDASAWRPMEQFGADLTYPTLLCARDGTLILTARRSFEHAPWELELWRKPPGEPWQCQGAILRAQRPNYSQFAASMSWEPDHRGICLSIRVYEQPSYAEPPVSYSWVGAMRSPDAGRTWQRFDGTPIPEPGTQDTVGAIFNTSTAGGGVADAGASIVDARGRPLVAYGNRRADKSDGYLAAWRDGAWQQTQLNPLLPVEQRRQALIMAGGMAMVAGRLILLAQVAAIPEGGDWWAHPTTRLVRFDAGAAGGSFSSRLIGGGISGQPQWLPSMERPTGFNEMPAHPGLLYTEGAAGGGLGDILTNQVWWQPLD